MTHTLRSRGLLGAIAITILSFAAHRADASTIISFDPDGPAGGAWGNNPFLQVSSIDFKPGNSLYQGIGSLLVNGTPTPVHYVQAEVNALNDQNGNPLSVPGLGVPSGFQLTMVMATPMAASISGANTSYSLGVGGTNFFKLFYNNSNIADDLAGTGFTAGTNILGGAITDAFGGFTRAVTSPDPLFDGFGADNYAGFLSKKVSGGGQYTVQVASSNASFFGSSLPAAFSFVMLNASDITPFAQQNPSHLFSDGTNPTVVPNLGNENGLGPDFQTQADANASFDVVPEPSSILLGVIGTLGLAAFVRRRRAS
jgi:PEP-CTERM motif